MTGLVSLLVTVVVVGLLAWLVFWGLAELGIPEPFAKIAKVLVVVIIVIYLFQRFSAFL